MSNWLTHFFLFCVKLFPTIMSLWKRPYLLKCNHARQEKINKSLRLNKLRLKQGSLTFDNDLVMPHAFFELVSYAQSCYAHTRLCCGRFAPWLIWKQADAAHSPAGSKKQEWLGKTWNLRSDCAARTLCPLSHGVSPCCAVRLELLPRKSSEAVAHVHHLLQLYNSEASNVLYDTAGCSLRSFKILHWKHKRLENELTINICLVLIVPASQV